MAHSIPIVRYHHVSPESGWSNGSSSIVPGFAVPCTHASCNTIPVVAATKNNNASEVGSALSHLPLSNLKGVGPRMAEKLGKIGLQTVQDLIFHLPSRYQDRTRISPIGALRPGMEISIQCQVDQADVVFRRRRMLLVRVSDGTGALTLRFFHFNKMQKASLVRGARLHCFGEVRAGANSLEMIHPEFRRVSDDDAPPDMAESLTPFYPTTEGVHQMTLRNLTEQAITLLDQGLKVEELLPESIRAHFQLKELNAALSFAHRPPPDAPLNLLAEGNHPDQQRLAFEELIAHALSLRELRYRAQQNPAPILDGSSSLADRFLDNLGFDLTGAQRRVCDEILADMKLGWPMQRLAQGDVGSGKTVVAAISALHAIDAGYQVALMAPTEILAEQHFRNFQDWLTPLGLEVAWLSGKQRSAERREALVRISGGSARIAIGTHALFQDEVAFHDLGLIIIDEQHRFGVHQRLALREKGAQGARYPHQLIMTATPIPRTLAMTAYADLDVSVIDELPPGRTPVKTVVLPDARRPDIIERIRSACAEGRQAYWVCTLIEESDALQAEAAEDTANLLTQSLPNLRVGLVHGRMKPAEKEAVMRHFKEADLDLLVATTVIEVGVDVPNASLMIIENAERLGLAQLHQLRGRVGRGAIASACVLMYHPPLSDTGKFRLGVMRETNDGFLIAQKDLELRGPGEVLGTRQNGVVQFRIADLARDHALLDDAQQAADELIRMDWPKCPDLVERWLGQGVRYGEV